MCVPAEVMVEDLTEFRLDKTAFSIASLSDESDEKAYWFGRTPQERMQALEWMRQTVYGYDPASIRLQRVLEITEHA
jgi:hypothetical protein